MSLNKEQVILYAALLLAAATLIYALFAVMGSPGSITLRNTQQDSVNQPDGFAQVNGFATIGSGSTDQGDVSIDLTPVKGGKQLKVLVTANTHSVDLSQFDLREITILEYDGRKIQPSAAPKLSGHHANGEIIFDVSVPSDSEFTIKMRSIPKEEERVFTWR
ncbi:MAG TPA: hypothetical protein VJB08_06745 [Candidatus Nanoarchaeia archaeon]|nr:hypothetical protein [Candidatus Nanoarchaeia archaeon]